MSQNKLIQICSIIWAAAPEVMMHSRYWGAGLFATIFLLKRPTQKGFSLQSLPRDLDTSNEVSAKKFQIGRRTKIYFKVRKANLKSEATSFDVDSSAKGDHFLIIPAARPGYIK